MLESSGVACTAFDPSRSRVWINESLDSISCLLPAATRAFHRLQTSGKEAAKVALDWAQRKRPGMAQGYHPELTERCPLHGLPYIGKIQLPVAATWTIATANWPTPLLFERKARVRTHFIFPRAVVEGLDHGVGDNCGIDVDALHVEVGEGNPAAESGVCFTS